MLKSIIFLVMISSTVQACYVKGDNPVLAYKIKEPKIESKDSPLLILLHGVGSNEAGLFQLAQHLPDEYLVVSARAPFVQSENKFKWYDVDFSTGRPIINYEQAEKSRLILKQFINQLKSLHTFDHQKIIIGGFSQGAIMSYSLGLTEPHLVKGIVSLSGRMLEEIKPIVRSEGLPKLNTLIIHGTKDRILPVAYARTAKSYLEQNNVPLAYHELNMGHTINLKAMDYLNDWLKIMN